MNNLLLVPATKPPWIHALLVAAQKPAERKGLDCRLQQCDFTVFANHGLVFYILHEFATGVQYTLYQQLIDKKIYALQTHNNLNCFIKTHSNLNLFITNHNNLDQFIITTNSNLTSQNFLTLYHVLGEVQIIHFICQNVTDVAQCIYQCTLPCFIRSFTRSTVDDQHWSRIFTRSHTNFFFWIPFDVRIGPLYSHL